MNLGNLQAAIFDFDGLIADTESVVFEAWRTVYIDLGEELDHATWAQAVGYASVFDPKADLEKRLEKTIDWDPIERNLKASQRVAFERLQPLPGALELIETFARAGCQLGCASNSDRPWVERGLTQLGVREHFQALVALGEAPANKPDPAPYRQVLEQLGVEAHCAIAFEDSEPGLRSAKGAGLYTIIVPGPITLHQQLDLADQRLETLASFDLPSTLEALGRTQR